jgi:hypothetical protein
VREDEQSQFSLRRGELVARFFVQFITEGHTCGNDIMPSCGTSTGLSDVSESKPSSKTTTPYQAISGNHSKIAMSLILYGNKGDRKRFEQIMSPLL